MIGPHTPEARQKQDQLLIRVILVILALLALNHGLKVVFNTNLSIIIADLGFPIHVQRSSPSSTDWVPLDLDQYECHASYTITILSRDPFVFLARGFLSDQEADHVLDVARSHLIPSTVVNSNAEYYVQSNYRTSSSAFLAKRMTPVIACIDHRVANLTQLPREHIEPLQVVHYLPGQEFKVHFDWLQKDALVDFWAQQYGQRVFTGLVYLNDERDGLQGGETEFPTLGIRVQPEKGTMLGWYNVDHLQQEGMRPYLPYTHINTMLFMICYIDHRTGHAGLPVIQGEKAAINIWVRNRTGLMAHTA